MIKKLLAHLKIVSKCSIYGILLQGTLLDPVMASVPDPVFMDKADEITITGRVTAVGAQDGLPGVNIVIKGTSAGTVTDSNGNYKIDVPSKESILVFSSIGFTTEEIAVESRTVIDVVLIQDIRTLGEIVIVGYGSQSKRNITGAVQTVDFDQFSDLPVAQITQKLQGQLAGVQVNQFTGKPGEGIKVRVRGQASISTNSDPLYVVDGFPIAGDINIINPNEIQTITVLKDAAATSLYGSRASNGVVLITTKQAKKGESIIGLNAFFGLQQVPERGRPDMMNAQEFAQFKKESYEAKGEAVPAVFQNPASYGEGTDWYDALLRTAPIQDYSLSLANAGEKHRVAVVAGYFDQDGVVLNSGFKRFSLRANTSFDITDWLTMGINVAPSLSTKNDLNTDGRFYTNGGKILNAASLAWPILPYQLPDGTIPPTAYIQGVSAFRSPNWYYTIQNLTDETKTNRLLSNVFLAAEIVKGLSVKTTINADWGQSKREFYNPSFVSTSWSNPPPRIATGGISNNQYLTWLNENTITYNKNVGDDHSLELLAGYTVQKYRLEGSGITASNYPDDRVPTIQSALNRNASNNISEWGLLSYIGRLNYNLRGKYLLTAAIRRDGSSRFGSNNKWGNFPSVSIGWIVSDEEFMANVTPVSFLKLRASYGAVGNNSIGNYTHLAGVNNTTAAVFGSSVVSGSSPSGLGNTDLGWETTTQFNVGLEFGVVNNRIQFTYDYYRKETSDLLYELAVPRESGFERIWTNLGKVRFWGHEIGLITNNLTGHLKWNTNFNIAFSDNKVLELSNLTDRVYGGSAMASGVPTSITKVGGRIGQIYGLVWDGVYDNQEEFESSPVNVNSEVGTIKYKDVNGDDVITYGGDDDDRTIIGNPYSKFTLGLTNDFSFKNFDVSIIMSGAFGHDIARVSDIGTTNLDGVFNVLKDVKDRWRSESDPGSGKYGKTTSATFMERDWLSSRFIHDASYLTVRNITLGYKIPLNNNVSIKTIRVYFSIQQAFVFTNYDGVNPEVTTQANGDGASDLNQGFDFSAYPVPRTFTFGFNLKL